ncbi:MAG: radical SAM protein [Candidatus Ranarchaeia archaeon]|jgi:radical SAM protein with 4Fe4S-binding SPASM domain
MTESKNVIFGKGNLEGHRFHLRQEKKGGTIVIDASRLLFLNETGYDYAVLAIQGILVEEAVKFMVKKYRVKPDIARADFEDLQEKILQFIEQPDVSPIETFDFGEVEPFGKEPFAPYRMDLALTYRCNNDCSHCYNPAERRTWDTSKELTTEQWKQVLDRLLDLSIPHVTFTGGEPTLRKDLVELVQYAEEIGIIAGLVTNGRLLTKDLVKSLVDAGIDYVQITLESHLPEVHDKMVGVKGAWKETVQGLDNFIPTDVYTITNTTLTQLNRAEIGKTVEWLASKGQTNFAMNGLIYSGQGKTIADDIAIPEEDLDDILTDVLMVANSHDMRLTWYTPTLYCNFNPEEYGLGPKRCTAALTSMAIEPNGDVLPCQSYYEPLGNLMSDPWKTIWEHPLSKQLRKHQHTNLMPECKTCEVVKACGGGCPLYVQDKTTKCKQ